MTFAWVSEAVLARALFDRDVQREVRYALLSERNMQAFAYQLGLPVSTIHMMHRRATGALIARKRRAKEAAHQD